VVVAALLGVVGGEDHLGEVVAGAPHLIEVVVVAGALPEGHQGEEGNFSG